MDVKVYYLNIVWVQLVHRCYLTHYYWVSWL